MTLVTICFTARDLGYFDPLIGSGDVELREAGTG